MTTVEHYKAFEQKYLGPSQIQTADELANSPLLQDQPAQRRRQRQQSRPYEQMVDINKQIYRKLTMKERFRIIILRYGGLHNFTQIKRSTTQISKICYVPFSTVARILKNFEASGHNLEQVSKKKKRSFKCIPPHIKEILVQQDMLQAWHPYSLVERVKLLENTLLVKISAHTLWKFYLSRGITIRTGQAVYRQFVTQSERVTRERNKFACLLGNLITSQRYQFIYMDETTYSNVQSKAKSWSTKERPVLHPKSSQQMRVTVFGAISTCLQDFRAFKLAKSTNKEDYCSFLLQIKQSVQQKYRSHKLILCYDGARAHTAKYSMDFIKDLFIPLQIPVMSCEFNSIEKFWHASKSHYNKRLMAQQTDISRETFHAMVNESLASVRNVERICRSNRRFLLQMLKQAQ